MNGICIKVCGQQKQMPANSNLEEALRRYSPYGEETVVCRLNGQVIRSIDDAASHLLNDGDELEIFPLIIGG